MLENGVKHLIEEIQEARLQCAKAETEALAAFLLRAFRGVGQAEAPQAPTAPEAALAAGADVILDAEGLPWDDRIHSSARSTTADGRWKVARNKDPKYVAKIKAELLNGSHQVAPAPPAARSFTDQLVNEDDDPVLPTIPAPEAEAPPAPPAAPGPISYTDLIQYIMGRIQGKTLAMDGVQAVLFARGVGSLPALQEDQALRQSIYQDLIGVSR